MKTKHQVSKTGEPSFQVISESSWQRKQANAKTMGLKDLRSKGKQDGESEVQILAPFEIRGNSHESVKLAGVLIDHDWRYSRKIQMVSLARKLINEAYFLGTLTDNLPEEIAKVIGPLDASGRDASLAIRRAEADLEVQQLLFQLNELYVQFEARHGRNLLPAMKVAAGEDKTAWKDDYIYRGSPEKVPLPYAIRNTSSHHNPNNHWGIEELRRAVALLEKWVTEPEGGEAEKNWR